MVFTQHFVEAPLAAITGWVFLGMTLYTCGLGDFLPSFFANLVKLSQVGWGHCWWTAVFRSLQRCLICLIWLGHSRTFTALSLSHCCVVLAVCLGLLSWWKINLRSSLRSWAPWNRFSLRISLYFAPFSFPSTLISLAVPAVEHPTAWCFTTIIISILQATDNSQNWGQTVQSWFNLESPSGVFFFANFKQVFSQQTQITQLTAPICPSKVHKLKVFA